MESSSESTSILENIAQFLLLAHERYFIKRESLQSLLIFLRDAGLLSNTYLSILDVERIRIDLYNYSKEDDDEVENRGTYDGIMSYDQFYKYLRIVAERLFGKSEKNQSSKAFGTLLYHHIVPMAMKEAEQAENDVSFFSVADSLNVQLLCEFEPFLLSFYLSMCSNQASLKLFKGYSLPNTTNFFP